MKIKISKKLRLKEYYAGMTIGRASNRTDYVAYAKLAAELGGKVTADELCHLFLRNLKKPVGKDILLECCDKGIFNWDLEKECATLTKTGQEMAKNEVAYLTEHGNYFLAFLNEPKIEKTLLVCHPIKNNSNRITEVNNHSTGRVINIPLNHEFNPFTEKKPEDPDKGWLKNSIKIYEIVPEKTFELTPELDLTLDLELSEIPRIVQLNLYGDFIDTISLFDCEQIFDEVFGALKQISELQNWDERKNILIVTPSEKLSDPIILNDSVRKITVNLKLDTIRLPTLFGDDDLDVEISDIPVITSNAEYAQDLFNQFLIENIVDYISKRDFDSLADEIKNKFLEYGDLDYNLKIPSQLELAEWMRGRARGNRAKVYWNLVAPIDLSLEGMHYAQ